MKKLALITGASRGIGRGIAIELAGLGWNLALNYCSQLEAANETRDLCLQKASLENKPIEVEIFQADIGEKSQRDRLAEAVRLQFDRIDLLVNNAGIAPQTRADILEASEESFDRLIEVNVKGPYFLTQKIALWMIRLREALGPEYCPQIITIGSLSAYTASINRGDYCISKAALAMITPLYAVRLAGHGIRVYEIRPGVIATNMTATVQSKYDKLIAEGLTPIRRWGEAVDVARAIAAIAQNLLPFSTGEVINVDGGFHLRSL